MTHSFYPCTQLLKTTISCISHPHRPFTFRASVGLILGVRISSRPSIIWSLSCSMRLDLSSLFGPHCIDHLSQITLPCMILCHDLSILQPVLWHFFFGPLLCVFQLYYRIIGSRHDFEYSTLATQVGSTFDVSVVYSIISFPFGLSECWRLIHTVQLLDHLSCCIPSI